jgi:hypothetical protein
MERMPRHPEGRTVRFGRICPKPERPNRGQGAGPGVLPGRELSDTRMPRTPVLRVGILVCLHFLWATVAGIVTIMLGWSIAWLIAGVVPVPRQYLTAGGITTLALAAAWLGPSVVERVAASHRLMRSSYQTASYGKAWINAGFNRQTQKH